MDFALLHPILGYLPRYAHARRLGWVPPGSVPLSDYVLLRRVSIERADQPIPYAALRANALDPYSTIDPLLDGVPRLVEQGLLDQSGDMYVLTAAGRTLLTDGERDANDYAASRIHLFRDDLDHLASALHDVTEALRLAPEPTVKTHQDRVPLLRRFDTRQSPPIQLEYAVYALQRARDDAHIAAWRAAGLEGPEIELLSHLWATHASTQDELVDLARARMQPDDVSAVLARLDRHGYANLAAGSVAISDRGREVRDFIEHETDRMYFAPWPSIDAGWVFRQLETVVMGLPPGNQPSRG